MPWPATRKNSRGAARRERPAGAGDGGLTTFQNRVDLHTHTTASDGGLTPRELVSQAGRQGLRVLAITDHDTTAGLPAALDEAARWAIRVVPGVEVSTLSGREEIHLLGYFVDLDNAELQALLQRTRVARRERARQMLVRLAKLGLPIDWERVVERAGPGGSIGRPHVAATLLEAGHVTTFHEAFELWIGRGCPAYVERYKLLPEEAIALIRGSGGLAVLAHPYVYDRHGRCRRGLELGRWLPRLCQAGLQGIEIYYPNYPRRVSRKLLALAIQYRLSITGGSDFHGSIMGSALGSVAVPWAAWQGLERRHRRLLARTDTGTSDQLASRSSRMAV